MRAFWATWALAFALVSCGGSNGAPAHVEISGKSPAEGGEIAARAVCMHQAQCGKPSIVCTVGGSSGGNPAGTTRCTATINPVDFDGCVRGASSDIGELLACPSLTPDQVDTLERCFDEMNAVKCVTQAEADERAHAAETGTAPPDEGPPAACALLTTPPAGCL